MRFSMTHTQDLRNVAAAVADDNANDDDYYYVDDSGTCMAASGMIVVKVGWKGGNPVKELLQLRVT